MDGDETFKINYDVNKPDIDMIIDEAKKAKSAINKVNNDNFVIEKEPNIDNEFVEKEIKNDNLKEGNYEEIVNDAETKILNDIVNQEEIVQEANHEEMVNDEATFNDIVDNEIVDDIVKNSKFFVDEINVNYLVDNNENANYENNLVDNNEIVNDEDNLVDINETVNDEKIVHNTVQQNIDDRATAKSYLILDNSLKIYIDSSLLINQDQFNLVELQDTCSVEEFIVWLRQSFALWKESQEIVLEFQKLELSISEDNIYSSDVTLSDLIEIYMSENELPMQVSVTTEKRFITAYNDYVNRLSSRSENLPDAANSTGLNCTNDTACKKKDNIESVEQPPVQGNARESVHKEEDMDDVDIEELLMSDSEVDQNFDLIEKINKENTCLLNSTLQKRDADQLLLEEQEIKKLRTENKIDQEITA